MAGRCTRPVAGGRWPIWTRSSMKHGVPSVAPTRPGRPMLPGRPRETAHGSEPYRQGRAIACGPLAGPHNSPAVEGRAHRHASGSLSPLPDPGPARPGPAPDARKNSAWPSPDFSRAFESFHASLSLSLSPSPSLAQGLAWRNAWRRAWADHRRGAESGAPRERVSRPSVSGTLSRPFTRLDGELYRGTRRLGDVGCESGVRAVMDGERRRSPPHTGVAPQRSAPTEKVRFRPQT